jgi:hypothetical protein
VLDGRGGSDTLIGLGGADTFAFTAALGTGNVDTVQDFGAEDRIGLASDVFSAVTAGGIEAGEVVLGTVAQDADDRLLYDQATGRLFYDADGNGAGAAVLFAQLSPGTALTAASFVTVAPVPTCQGREAGLHAPATVLSVAYTGSRSRAWARRRTRIKRGRRSQARRSRSRSAG